MKQLPKEFGFIEKVNLLIKQAKERFYNSILNKDDDNPRTRGFDTKLQALQ